MVNIEGLSHPSVLARLYNKSKGIGIGKYQCNPKHNMTYREAETLLETKTYFDLLYGRVMYISIKPEDIEIDNTTYDKYLGEGYMEKIINELKELKGIK